MTGESNWIPIAMVLASGILLVGLAVSTRLWFRYLRSEERLLVCPTSGNEVACVPVRDTRTGEWTGVQRCSAHPDPNDVRCSMNCLKQLETQTPEGHQPAPSGASA